jgi:hypothetical protein
VVDKIKNKKRIKREQMTKKNEKVYQFKITLKGIRPPIWRRIQVPETYSFWDLHVAIQDSFGWMDYHLHNFEILNPRTGELEEIGIPNDGGWGSVEILAGWKRKISRYFPGKTLNKAIYTYDFGDTWKHEVRLEKILPRDPNAKYPVCTGGRRACPPEDCGGIWGYEDLLAIIMDPEHEQHEEMVEWVGEHFDPEDFDINEIHFDDPKDRLTYVLG